MPICPAVEVSPPPVFPTWDGGPLPVVLLRFDASRFDPALYARHRVAYPPSIAASVVQRQADYFYGRLAASMALSRLGLANHNVGTGAFREPVWPTGVFGSISHNRQLAVAVAARRESNGGIGIGIDIESLEGQALLEEPVISARELAYLSSLESHWQLANLTTLVFSAKESFFKAAFAAAGRYFDFDAIEVQRIDLAAQTIAFRLVARLSPELPAGVMREVRFMMLDATTILTACNLPPR